MAYYSDYTRLIGLESKYVDKNDPECLTELYTELARLSKSLLLGGVWEDGDYVPDFLDVIAHDAVTRLIEMYLKHPGWRMGPYAWHDRLKSELIFQIYGPHMANIKRKKIVEYILPNVDYSTDNPEKTCKSLYVNDILQDDGVNGRRIIIDLCLNKHYKRAILSISTYTTKRWIYDHAVVLRSVWKTLQIKD